VRLRDSARLRYWLGPWAAHDELPPDVTVRVVGRLPAGSRLYAPTDRAPRGGFVISPGLHHDGPNDPRMDRLARILARAGFVVLSPAVPDLMALQLTPAVIDDVSRALDVLLAAPELPAGCAPSLFAISVGSLAALRVAARSRDLVAQVVVFGGYADHTALIRSLTDEPRDPLNRPAAMLTLLAHIPGAPRGRDAERLRAAWRRTIRATWPLPSLKVAGGTLHHPIARAFAAELPPHLRELYLVGCGVLPGAWELCRHALAAPGAFDYLDPRPHLAGIRCPVTIVHGIADDVIPFEQAGALERALPPHVACTQLATGMFSHSSATGLRAVALARELRTFERICRALGGTS